MSKGYDLIASLWDMMQKYIWLNSYKMKTDLKGYTPSEIHCLDYIGKNAGSNVTRLADAFYMTRGAISKMTKKLMEKELVQSYQKPENKKEIYFRLTEQGKEVFNIHQNLHREFQTRDKAVFDQFTDEQLEIMLDFVRVYSEHLDAEIDKLGVDLKTERYDKL